MDWLHKFVSQTNKAVEYLDKHAEGKGTRKLTTKALDTYVNKMLKLCDIVRKERPEDNQTYGKAFTYSLVSRVEDDDNKIKFIVDIFELYDGKLIPQSVKSNPHGPWDRADKNQVAQTIHNAYLSREAKKRAAEKYAASFIGRLVAKYRNMKVAAI